MKKVFRRGLAVLLSAGLFIMSNISVQAAGYTEVSDSDEQIAEEERLGDMELIAQLVEAEAGNQPFEGKCLVVDVVLNRVASPDFPNTVEEVIYQDGQFSVINNGAFDKAAWNMKEDDFAAVAVEYELHTNKEILYFNNSSNVSGTGEPFKVGGHWFNT